MNAINPVPSHAAGAEPSMEEILASIRRIIADDQPQSGSGSLETSAQAPASSGSVRAEPSELPAKPMPSEHGAVAAPQFPSPEASGVMGSPHPLAPQVPEPAADGRLPTLATPEDAYEISAPEPDTHEAALADLHDVPSARDAVLDTPAYEARPVEKAAPEDQVLGMLEHRVLQAATEEAPVPDPTDIEAALRGMSAHKYAKDETRMREPVAPEPVAPAHDAAGGPEAGLFSAATSQSLASAFNTLAISRLADDSRELRGLAREMLRPLLKDWLDDHLPGLVESIIREEIERMARRVR